MPARSWEDPQFDPEEWSDSEKLIVRHLAKLAGNGKTTHTNPVHVRKDIDNDEVSALFVEATMNRLCDEKLLQFSNPIYYLNHKGLCDASWLMDHPPPRDRYEEAYQRFRQSRLAPLHFYATTFLPYVATLISILSLCVAFAAFWTRPVSPETGSGTSAAAAIDPKSPPEVDDTPPAAEQ